MRSTLPFLTLIVILAVALTGRAAEPITASPSDPSVTLHSFYHWYVTELIANHDPLKNRATMQRFVTKRLLSEIDKAVKSPEGLDADYFLDAQDFDNQWADHISISKVKVSGDKATADVLLTGQETMRRQLRVALIKEGNTWKVDKARGYE